MDPETTLARCSKCGKEAPRGEMFGLEPDLLCDACAHQVRKRTAPKAVGRLANAFVGRPTPLTVLFLGVAAGLFLLTHVVWRSTPPDQIPEWFWLITPGVRAGKLPAGEWWRLITVAFLHGGWIHILFNGLWIWSLGRAVEGTRGSLRYLLIFLGSAAFASAAQIYFSKAGGIGLSGVLYALAGYLWLRRREDAVAASVMNPSTSRLLGTWFVLCWFLPLNIGNWAHAGGLVWGLAAGWISLQEEKGTRIAGAAALLAATVAASWWVTSGHIL
jgi:membrane associated rhomboid family serine protease